MHDPRDRPPEQTAACAGSTDNPAIAKCAPLIWALTLFFLVDVEVRALIGIWQNGYIWVPDYGPILRAHGPSGPIGGFGVGGSLVTGVS